MATAVNGPSGQIVAAPNFARLPLQPRITPALAVAGTILILSGTVYNLIGIKNRRLQISLSAAYLASLSVTVLIVYVSNPPVSNGVQGAYFVAAFISGVILGAASLVFTEVTDGLGCLLGGFSVSMWFLVLRAGGLITSTGGKAGFVAAFCLVAYALSFNGYTRPYALIGGTSFAGATAVVIGIDCYSRAGLKEFWLYLWALNDNIFPLAPSTYPITRGIRVEIACIILLSVLGIMSQLKIWIVIKERRQQKMAKHKDEEQRHEQNEEELGRRLEEANNRERARWEAVYGDKEQPTIQHVDSGVGSEEFGGVRKGPTSINEARIAEEPRTEAMEMENLEVSVAPNEAGLFTNIGDAILEDRKRTLRLRQEVDTTSGILEVTPANKCSVSPSTGVSVVDDLRDMIEGTNMAFQGDHGEESVCHRPSTPGKGSVPTQVTPLPFPNPDSNVEDASSMAACAASDYFPPCRNNRLSGPSQFSKRSRHSRLASASEESLPGPQDFDDRRFTPSGTVSVNSIGSDHKDGDQMMAGERGAARNSIKRKPVPSAAASPQSDFSGCTATAVGTPTQSRLVEVTHSLGLAKSVVPSEPFSGHLRRTSLGEHLPEGGSPLVITHRTNEWAKHLDRAEKPALDELKSSVNELPPNSEQVREIPVPVDVGGLEQRSTVLPTAQSSSQPGLSRRLQNLSTDGTPFMMSKDSLPNLRNLQANADSGVSAYSQSPARSPSQLSLQSPQTWNGLSYQASVKPTTQQSTNLVTQACRGASAPMSGQMLVESPIEEDVVTSFPPQPISPMPKNTLMAKRGNLLRNRYSHTTLAHLTLSTGDHGAEIIASDSASVHSNVTSSRDDENITLSQRRSLLQQAKRHTSLPQAQASSPYNSSQPLRSSSALTDLERRELMLASWRSSVRQELNSSSTLQIQSEIDARRTELMNEKYQLGLSREQSALTASYRDSMIDQAMRRGEMLDVHREAMRKLQAAANRHF